MKHAGVQGGGAGLRGCGQERPHGTVCFGMLHGKVRPDNRGLLPQGDRGGPVAMRAGDPGHRWDRAVREYARPLHQERPGFRGCVQSDQPPDIPGHQGYEGAHHPRERHRASAGAFGRKQARP